MSRLGGGSSGGGSRRRASSSSGPKFSGGGGNAVVQLDDDNFEEQVMDSNDMWMVAFTAPWCGHCKNLMPHWEKASGELKGIVQFALQELAKSGWKPDVKEVVSQQGFDAACKDNTLCILGFLPAI